MCNATLNAPYIIRKSINVDPIKKQITFNSDAIFFKSNWRYCHLVVDAISNLSKSLCSSYKQSSLYTLSSILNEIFENIVKFSILEKPDVSLTLSLKDDYFLLTSVNYTTEAHYAKLESLNNKLTNYQEDDLFTKQLESLTAETSVSELGIISLYQYRDLELEITKSIIDGLIQVRIDVMFTIRD